MARTKQEIIKQINNDFKCLIKNLPHRSTELQAKKIEILGKLNIIDNSAFETMRQICSPYIPEETKALLENMCNSGLSTEGVETEDQLSTLLVHLLTPEFNLSQEEIAYCNTIPEDTTVDFLNHIGMDNIIHMQAQNAVIFAAREEAIDELLAQIPSNPFLEFFPHIEY